MKTTITLSPRGAVTLPARLRREAGLQPNDALIAEVTPEGILLRPAITLPVEIYSESRLQEFAREESALARVLERKSRV